MSPPITFPQLPIRVYIYIYIYIHICLFIYIYIYKNMKTYRFSDVPRNARNDLQTRSRSQKRIPDGLINIFYCPHANRRQLRRSFDVFEKVATFVLLKKSQRSGISNTFSKKSQRKHVLSYVLRYLDWMNGTRAPTSKRNVRYVIRFIDARPGRRRKREN